MLRRVLVTFGGVLLLAGSLAWPARAQESAANPEIERLKAQLAAQQQQIDQLRRTLEDQQKTLEEASRPKPVSLGEVASTSPVLPVSDVAPALHPGLAGALNPQKGTDEPEPSPLQIRLGSSTITPVGFMDMTYVFRSRDGGSSIGTNFGSVPYGNTPLGNLTESRFSTQNSRIGARFDTMVHGTKVLAYWESDFLGTQSGNAGVSSNSNSFRIRLYWVDLRKGKWEILGGQSWSMLTPGRKGISPLPGDLFYSQDMDTNYQVGLSWTRAPQFRFVYHASPVVTWGLSLEQAEQYGGGSGGGGTIVIPSALATNFANQVNTGSQTFNVPNLAPDVQTKIAFDPMVDGKLMHIEFAGFLSAFKTYQGGSTFTKTGGGGTAGFNLELVKNFRIIANAFISDGGGRYLFGEAPDLAIRPNGAPMPIHADSTVDGFEYTAHNTTFFAYYGGILIGRAAIIDNTNKNVFVGYGYPGSSTGQNRTMQEGTFGFNSTFWKNPNYGALSFIFQYSYLFRNPWAPPATGPRSANNNMIWLDLRYTLPGAAPAPPKK